MIPLSRFVRLGVKIAIGFSVGSFILYGTSVEPGKLDIPQKSGLRHGNKYNPDLSVVLD